jgi:hypothetical protein
MPFLRTEGMPMHSSGGDPFVFEFDFDFVGLGIPYVVADKPIRSAYCAAWRIRGAE